MVSRPMRRRELLKAVPAASVAAVLPWSSRRTSAATSRIRRLVLGGTSSLVAPGDEPLTDDGLVVVRTETTATNDATDRPPAVSYPEDAAIPVVAADGPAVGFGGLLVDDTTNFEWGNEEFMLNVYDDAVGGSGTVLFDEGHGQFNTLSGFSSFVDHAGENGYAVESTRTLAADLPNADALVVVPHAVPFTPAELVLLEQFLADGGALFLHGNRGLFATNLNLIAEWLGLAFRFNTNQVRDEANNAYSTVRPLTDVFDTSFPYFDARDSIGFERGETYTADVTDVIDGDSIDVRFADGTEETVRVLGIDTPETSASATSPKEWEGIESQSHLETWGNRAESFARGELEGTTVDLRLDTSERVRGAFGRLLAYVYYDADGDGSRDAFYSERAARQGYARVYDSSTTEHDTIRDAERAARTNGRGVWTASDLENTTEVRDDPVDALAFPWAATVRTAGGTVSADRVPVVASSTASQDLDGGVAYNDDLPLVAVDRAANVGVVGAPLVNEAFDTADQQNQVFLANLLDYLADATGDVLVDGGHGQFNAPNATTAEDAVFYLRYLEGVGLGFEGVNDLTTANLLSGRALLVTTPRSAFTAAEIDAVRTFRDDGGAVVLLGTGKVTDEPRSYLNDLADGLETDLRVNQDQVVDDSNNVDGDGEVPTTSSFDASFPLFDPYT